MNSNRKAATVAGWLYLLGFVTGILSVAYAVDAPDYLLKAAANANEVMTAAFFHLMMAPASVGIVIALYPVLRQYHPHLAFGFASFRVIAGGFIILGVVFLLLILTLSQEFVRAGAPEAAYFQTLGVLLQAGRDLVNHIAMVLAVSLSGLMYYALLYQTRLVPRWLSGWNHADDFRNLVGHVPSHRHHHVKLPGFEFSHGFTGNGFGGLADRQRIPSNRMN
jgi:hypothetical protein